MQTLTLTRQDNSRLGNEMWDAVALMGLCEDDSPKDGELEFMVGDQMIVFHFTATPGSERYYRGTYDTPSYSEFTVGVEVTGVEAYDENDNKIEVVYDKAAVNGDYDF